MHERWELIEEENGDDNDAETSLEHTERSVKVRGKKDGTDKRRKRRRGGEDPEKRRQKHSSVSFQQP